MGAPQQNKVAPLDVSGDGKVSAGDAIRVVNFLNRVGSSAIRRSTTAEGESASFLDVSGDNRVTALDAIRVINALARNGGEFQVDAIFGDGADSELVVDAGAIAVASMFGDDDDETQRDPVTTIGALGS